jgi:organic radical activating enzyme
MHIIYKDELATANSEGLRKLLAEEISSFLRSKKIVVYGAGQMGFLLFKALEAHRLVPAVYVDRRYEPGIFDQFCGVVLRPPESLKDYNDAATVIIVAISTELIVDLAVAPLNLVQKYAPDAYVLDETLMLTFALREQICSSDIEHTALIDCLRCFGYSTQGQKLCHYYTQRCHKMAVGANRRVGYKSARFDWFGYMVSQRCTLRCKYCCECIPYITNGKFVDKDDIIADCAKMADACEFLDYIELIGGEPFLHPNIGEVLDGLLHLPNIGYIKIFTNGTIEPSINMIELLKNPRIVVMFSNYLKQVKEDLKSKILRTKNILDANEVPYIFVVGDVWSDYGSFEKRNLAPDVLDKKCSSCYIHNCHRLFDGKLYQCPIHYSFLQCERNGQDDADVIDIRNCVQEELAHKLDEMEEQKSFEACDYCMLPFDGRQIPAGEQL